MSETLLYIVMAASDHRAFLGPAALGALVVILIFELLRFGRGEWREYDKEENDAGKG